MRGVVDKRSSPEWQGVKQNLPVCLWEDVRRSSLHCLTALEELWDCGLPNGDGSMDLTGGHVGLNERWDFSAYIVDGKHAGKTVWGDAFTCDAPTVLHGQAQRMMEWAVNALKDKERDAAWRVYKEGLRTGAPLILLVLLQHPPRVPFSGSGRYRNARVRVTLYELFHNQVTCMGGRKGVFI